MVGILTVIWGIFKFFVPFAKQLGANVGFLSLSAIREQRMKHQKVLAKKIIFLFSVESNSCFVALRWQNGFRLD